MNNHFQISLFFKEKIIFDPIKMANIISESFPKLEHGVALPISVVQDNSDIPLVIFNQNQDMKINVSFNNLIIDLLEENKNQLTEIINKIYKIFENFDIKISRIGYVINMLKDESEILKFKENNFKKTECINSSEFQLSWYKKCTIEGINVNCWQRYFTNLIQSNNLFVIIDINTLADEKLIIDVKYVLNYVNNIDKFIEKNKMR